MQSVRLRELPPAVVDEFVNMHLKKSQRVGVTSDDNRYASTNASEDGTPGPYKVEYRLVNKKKPPRRNGERDFTDSPSSLRYVSPIPQRQMRQPPPSRQIILKPIEQSAHTESSRTVVPARKQLKTPELIQLSVQRINSFDSVMYPLGGSIENASPMKNIPPIQIHSSLNQSARQGFPTVTHSFVCPQCKCHIHKDLVITLAENFPEPNDSQLNHSHRSPERSHSKASSVPIATQTEDAELGLTRHQNSYQKPSSISEAARKIVVVDNSTLTDSELFEDVHHNDHPVLDNCTSTDPNMFSTVSRRPTAAQIPVLDNCTSTDSKAFSRRSTTVVPLRDPIEEEHLKRPESVAEPPPEHLTKDPTDPEVKSSVGDMKVVDHCRKVIKDAEADGTVEVIHLAIRELALVAQKHLSIMNSQALAHGRIICGKIGDAISHEEFYARMYQVLQRMVNEWEFFAHEESYHLTFNLFTDFTSFLQSSSEMASSLVKQTKFVAQILSILQYKKYVNQLTQKNMWRFFEACLTVLCHLSQNATLLNELRSAGIVQASRRFLSTGELGYAGLWQSATVTMARIATVDEIASSVKGKLSDFIPPLTGFIIASFDGSKADDGDNTARSIASNNNDGGENDVSKNATSPMPRGAAVEPVDLVEAFLHFLKIIAMKHQSLDQDHHVVQSELDELLKCSQFLLKLPRPTAQRDQHHLNNKHDKNDNKQQRDVTLHDWRRLVKSGIEMAAVNHDLNVFSKLSFDEKKKINDKIIADLSHAISTLEDEYTLKSDAELLLAKIQQPRNPTPAPRSITATIDRSHQKTQHENEQRHETPEAGNQPNLRDASARYSSNETLWNSSLIAWQPQQVRTWMRSIGLQQFEAEFEDYDGSMLLALYDVRRESPQYFQKEIATKLGGNFNHLVRFTAELTKLVAQHHLVPASNQSVTIAGIDQNSLAL